MIIEPGEGQQVRVWIATPQTGPDEDMSQWTQLGWVEGTGLTYQDEASPVYRYAGERWTVAEVVTGRAVALPHPVSIGRFVGQVTLRRRADYATDAAWAARGPAQFEPAGQAADRPAGSGDILDSVADDGSLLCACGCRVPVDEHSPSAYFATQECSERWHTALPRPGRLPGSGPAQPIDPTPTTESRDWPSWRSADERATDTPPWWSDLPTPTAARPAVDPPSGGSYHNPVLLERETDAGRRPDAALLGDSNYSRWMRDHRIQERMLDAIFAPPPAHLHISWVSGD